MKASWYAISSSRVAQSTNSAVTRAHVERERLTSFRVAQIEPAEEHAVVVVDLLEQLLREVEEGLARLRRVCVVLQQLQQGVQQRGERGAATERRFEEVETIALHADAEEMRDVPLVQRLVEDEVDDAEHALGNVGIVHVRLAGLLVLVDARI